MELMHKYNLKAMSIDDYGLHRYLLMCIYKHNLKAMRINDYGLYGSFLNV